MCLAYDGGLEPPPARQVAAAVELCAHLALRLGLPAERVLGHRELEGTGYTVEDGRVIERKECPGKAIDMDAFRRRVADAMARPGGAEMGEA